KRICARSVAFHLSIHSCSFSFRMCFVIAHFIFLLLISFGPGTRNRTSKMTHAHMANAQSPAYQSGMLINVAQRGEVKEIESCLSLGASIDERDAHFGYTPLMHAARWNHIDAV